MRNLTPLTRKISYWDNIVNNKDLAARIALQAIRPEVELRFGVYTQHTRGNSLAAITASPFIAPISTYLKGCYSNSHELSVLKARILDRQESFLQAECQYCNIASPDTFDHYLPKGDFPEFSALSINLIPCCPTCNNKKGEEWLLHGNRKIINYYFDTLPNVAYLNCQITYRNNTPRANFTINAALIPIGIRQTVIHHYDVLKLVTRYKLRSNSEFEDVLAAITPYVGILTRAQIHAQILNEAEKMRAKRGVNYWRAILRVALANSDRFLTDAGF